MIPRAMVGGTMTSVAMRSQPHADAKIPNCGPFTGGFVSRFVTALMSASVRYLQASTVAPPPGPWGSVVAPAGAWVAWPALVVAPAGVVAPAPPPQEIGRAHV